MEQISKSAAEGENQKPKEDKEQLKPKQIITAKGSVYSYLPDGRTQRFKKATGENFEPMDVMVFVPPWEIIKDKIPHRYTEFFSGVMDEFEYDQLLLSYVHLEGKKVVIVDKNGDQIKTQKEADLSERLFLGFIDKINNKLDFYIPVVKDPRVGFNTFDASYKMEENGLERRWYHLGNKVVDIKY